MAQGSESNFRLLASFIASNRSVLNTKIMIEQASDMQLRLLFIQQIGSLAQFIQRVIVDIVNMGLTK